MAPQEELDRLGLREAMLFAKPIRDVGERPVAMGGIMEVTDRDVFSGQPGVNICIDAAYLP